MPPAQHLKTGMFRNANVCSMTSRPDIVRTALPDFGGVMKKGPCYNRNRKREGGGGGGGGGGGFWIPPPGQQ